MKEYILILIIFASILNLFGVEKERKEIISKEIVIDRIHSGYIVLDEWKNPGLYSPANMFDGDSNTCFAENHFEPSSSKDQKNFIGISMDFKNPVYVDEIRIMNGFGKNDSYFKNNNRVKKLSINIPPNRGFERTILTLEDKKEFQSFKFDKSYLLQIFKINNDGKDESIYKGDNYDDTCITEIEFYNQGKKIPVKNIKEVKKNYIDSIDSFLNYIMSGDKGERLGSKWKVEDKKLYKYINEKWVLVKYFIAGDDSIEVFDEDENCTVFYTEGGLNECSRFGLTKKKFR